MTGHVDGRLRDAALLAARNGHVARMRALFGGQPGDEAFVLWGQPGQTDVDPYREPERWVSNALDDLALRADVLRDPRVFRPVVVEFGPYGVHFVDRILGAEVFELGERDNWQIRTLDTPIGQLARPELAHDEIWGLARRVARAFVDSGMTVPLFGLPTLSSALNVAVNLYGQHVLLAMLTDPDAVRHDLGVINDLICELHRWYLDNIPLDQLQPVVAAYRTQPPGHGQLCGCTTQLISPEQYSDFIAPLDDELLRTYPYGGMIHLCGTHTQHIPTWRKMASLRAIQLNDRAAVDLATYFEALRDDQVLYVNPSEEMPIERIMAITGGRRVVIVADTEDRLPVAAA